MAGLVRMWAAVPHIRGAAWPGLAPPQLLPWAVSRLLNIAPWKLRAESVVDVLCVVASLRDRE